MGGGRFGRFARISGGALLTVLALGACSRADVEERLRFGWPRGITEQASDMRVLWTWSSVAALAVGVVVWGLMFWAMIAYRRRGGDLPRQTKYNLPIEAVYTVVPFLIIAVLFYFTVATENDVLASDEPDTTVEVVAFKWNWEFRYTDQRDQETDEVVYTVGTPNEIAVLVIPEGRSVRFREFSNDVVHSFWVPEFLFKRDVFPLPQVNQFQINATEQGSYVGRCAELCGTYHSQMNFEVRVVSDQDYQAYLDALGELGNADPDRQAKALTAIGQAPRATTTYPFDTDRTDRAPSERPAAQD